MIWVDREVKKIKERHFPLEWVDDMKTPSGRVHVGALRGVVIHDLIYKVLLENNLKAKFTYVFNDMDPMDAIPAYLDKKIWEKYSGIPLNKVPSPVKGFQNFAQYFAQEFIDVFNSINCHPEIIWSSKLYASGKMNDIIKKILDNADKIREIYYRISKNTRPDDWYPFSVTCEKCGKVGTTYVYKWDGRSVYYRCEPAMVEWAKGCGYEGKISPFDGRGKLPWKLDWPAYWKNIGVTIEGAGKDHMSSGGSHEIATTVAKEVLNYQAPYPIPYEWFTIGGRKMSSSKGVGSSAKEISQILPPEVLRFLIVRTQIETALDFNPYGDTILNLFDDFDRCLNAYFDKLENKVAKGKPGEVALGFARIAELSQVKPLPKKRFLLPRFRTVVNLLKTKTDLVKFFTEHKKTALTKEEKEILEERIVFANIYLKNYAKSEEKIEFLKETPKNIKLTNEQKLFLSKLKEKLTTIKIKNKETIQNAVFETLKENSLKPKEVFPGFYQLLIGRDFGPKAADILIDFGIENFIKKISQLP